jgi:hypothetical protein
MTVFRWQGAPASAGVRACEALDALGKSGCGIVDYRADAVRVPPNRFSKGILV